MSTIVINIIVGAHALQERRLMLRELLHSSFLRLVFAAREVGGALAVAARSRGGGGGGGGGAGAE